MKNWWPTNNKAVLKNALVYLMLFVGLVWLYRIDRHGKDKIETSATFVYQQF